MKTKLSWIVLAIVIVAVVAVCVWKCCKPGRQIENQIINVYIKIFCER